MAKMPMTTNEEAKKDMAERKKGGHIARKRGGQIPGQKGMNRPDRRARGGATSDPLTSAGKMTKLPYEAAQQPTDAHGKGPDWD